MIIECPYCGNDVELTFISRHEIVEDDECDCGAYVKASIKIEWTPPKKAERTAAGLRLP